MGKKMPATVINLDGVSVFPRWYTVVTKYNYEAKLASNIMMGAEKFGLSNKIFEVLVPIKETIEFKYVKGEKKEKKKHEKIYPLYIFVKAIMNDDVWNYIKNSDGSSTILAPGGTPIVIEESEILKIKKQCGLNEPEEVEESEFFIPEIGHDVEVMEGIMRGQFGKIIQVQGRKITLNINGMSVVIDISLLERVEFVD